MYDFGQIFRRVYGDAITDSPAGLAAMKAAKARYDAAGTLAEQIVTEQYQTPPGLELPRPSEAPTLVEMRERLNLRLRA